MITIGAAIMASMMFLTVLDVGLRYIFNSPLHGAFELVEYMMATLVPFSIVYCAYHKGHVSVELIIERFPRKLKVLCNIVTNLIALLFVAAISWQNVLYFFEVKASNLTSAVLLIPTYPFVIPIALGFFAYALILLLHLIELLREVFT